MNVDPKIQEAIEVSVSKEGQPRALSHKLTRWFEVIATGSEDLNDRQSAFRHLELLYAELETTAFSEHSKLSEDVSARTDEEDDTPW